MPKPFEVGDRVVVTTPSVSSGITSWIGVTGTVCSTATTVKFIPDFVPDDYADHTDSLMRQGAGFQRTRIQHLPPWESDDGPAF